jgi:hypothetical protein
MSDALSATGPAPLPDDVAALQSLLLVERARAERLSDQNERLRAILRELQRALFGRRSETSWSWRSRMSSRRSPRPRRRRRRAMRR